MRCDHGGNVHRLARELRCSASEILDCSASINPMGPSLSVMRALRKDLWTIRHYPDPEQHDLVHALSKRVGLSSDRLLVGNGSAELLYLLPIALQIKDALLIGPTFSEYEPAILQAGGHCTSVMAGRTEDYRPPLERAVEEICRWRGQVDAVYLCNPNSPTGRMVPRMELQAFIETVAKSDLWIVIDESFIEFSGEPSIQNELHRYERLIIVKSFTKFYSLPGLRVGYLLGHPDVIDRLRQRQPPWAVNALAQTAAVAALKDSSYRKKSLRLVSEERTSLVRDLSGIQGLTVFPSVVNFLLLELPAMATARATVERLRREKILVRDCSTIPGLNERTIRVAVRTARDNQRLVRALETALHG